ncbi:MAG: hypothetical protein AAF383_31675 [Cyanobacteria bacterium P01_A01_bin.83]
MSKKQIQQALQEILDKFEQLSNENEFEVICQQSRIYNDISLSDSWQGIEAAIDLLNQKVI